MSDVGIAMPQGGQTAGGLLRQARKAQGLHIAALAASIKVTPQKLEALESDRYDDLPDATFARALAKTVCRVLKIDAEPVLALLPQNVSKGFERLGGGLNTPFRERSGRAEGFDGAILRSPAVWGPVLLVIAAAVVWLLPSDVLRLKRVVAPTESASAPAASPAPVLEVPSPASAPASSVGGDVAIPPMIAVAPAASDNAGAVAGGAASSPGGDAKPAGLVVVRTAAKPSWVEVLDSEGHTLISRDLQADEAVALDGTPPLRVKIGNAKSTQIEFRGQPVDLASVTTGNVARLELK